MKNKPLFLLGAGGHAKVLLDIIRLNGFQIEGIVTPEKNMGVLWNGVTVVGSDDVVFEHPPSSILLVNGLGSTGLLGRRKLLFTKFKEKGYSFAKIIHPTAIIAGDVELAEGVQVMAGAVIQPGTKIGMNSIINTHATVDHDSIIGPHVHISPGVTLSGEVVIKECVHIGTGASVIQGKIIEKNSLVGAGALVIRNVEEQQMVLGVPAKLAKTMKDWRNVLIQPSTSIKNAIQVIDAEALKIALVVRKDDFLLGTVTDGDIRRALMKGAALNDPVKKIMNPNPVFVPKGSGRSIILSIMKEKSIQQIPVVDKQGRVIHLEFLENLVLGGKTS